MADNDEEQHHVNDDKPTAESSADGSIGIETTTEISSPPPPLPQQQNQPQQRQREHPQKHWIKTPPPDTTTNSDDDLGVGKGTTAATFKADPPARVGQVGGGNMMPAGAAARAAAGGGVIAGGRAPADGPRVRGGARREQQLAAPRPNRHHRQQQQVGDINGGEGNDDEGVRHGAGFIPRVFLHIPEWASPPITAMSRSWKMSLLVAGCVGVFCVIGSTMVSMGNAAAQNETYVRSNHMAVRPSFSTSGGDPPPAQVELDPILGLLGDFPHEAKEESDVPFFWDVPYSRGGFMMEILSKCAGSVLAGNMPGYNDLALTEVKTESGTYINVDTYSHEGIIRAHNLGLVEANIANIILSPLPYQAVSLFNPSRRGRMITLLQNPIDRIYSHYNHVTGTHCNPSIETCLSPGLSLREYIESAEDRPEFNWMTKTLSNKPPNFSSSELTTNDLNIAKEFLRRKAIVGMLDDKGDALLRFKIYFGWFYPNGVCQCVEKRLHWEWPKDGDDTIILEEGSDAFEEIKLRNSFDMDLYLYAKKLSDDQFHNYFHINED